MTHFDLSQLLRSFSFRRGSSQVRRIRQAPEMIERSSFRIAPELPQRSRGASIQPRQRAFSFSRRIGRGTPSRLPSNAFIDRNILRTRIENGRPQRINPPSVQFAERRGIKNISTGRFRLIVSDRDRNRIATPARVRRSVAR